MNVKACFFSLLCLTLLFGLSACSDLERDKVSTVTEIKSSILHAGSELHMEYHIDGEIKVEQAVTIELSFQAEPNQLIELEVTDSDQYQWLQMLDAAYAADESGVVEVQFNVLPLVAGKMYIKFIAATVDGDSIRAFAIALAVHDVNNIIPEKSKSTVNRIDLPAAVR